MEPKGNDMAGDELVERLQRVADERCRAEPITDRGDFMHVYAKMSRADGLLMREAAARLSRSTSTDAVAAEVAVLRYMAECVDTHADKFPVPKHMHSHAVATREIANRLEAALTYPSLQGGAEPDGAGKYPDGLTASDHIAHDMKAGRFPQQSSVATFIAERHSLGETGGTETGELPAKAPEYESDDLPFKAWKDGWNAMHDQAFPLLTSLRAERDRAQEEANIYWNGINDLAAKHEVAESSLAAEKLKVEGLETKLFASSQYDATPREGRAIMAEAAAIARADAAEQRVAALVGALKPDADTKAAYIGEFKFSIEDRDEDGEECQREVVVPWTTVKEIMKAISDRAALATEA